MESIKEHINNYIKEHNVTVNAIACAIGISRSSLYDKLNGKRPWMLTEVIDLADYMGCTVNDLLVSPEVAA